MIQSNWICKGSVVLPPATDDVELEEAAPEGRLRAIRAQVFGGGTTNNRGVFFRVPMLKRLPLSYHHQVVAGYNTWHGLNATAGNVYIFYCDVNSPEPIRFFMRGNANADGYGIEFSFWYEPESTDEDAKLSPLGNVNRGGVIRKGG